MTMITVALIAWVIYLLWQNSRLKADIRDLRIDMGMETEEDEDWLADLEERERREEEK